ncbi:MAG: hypothetical protein JEZ07_14595 [Phycisphaerae bacterium]|nr:hypothetical protein [Phycisphaerae bacterium]
MGIIRIIKRIIIGRNATDGSINNLGSSGEIHNLSDNGGPLETIYFQELTILHCGCFAAPGGRCSECGVISCIGCHRHCGGTINPSPLGCGKPLCREHCKYLTLDNGQITPFCKDCSSKISRKKVNKKVKHLLLSPFVELGDKQDE